jgi:hypothetical protein
MVRSRSKKAKRDRRAKKTPNETGEIFLRPSSILVDPAKRRVFVFTDDILLNQLRRDGPKIEESFDQLCSDDLGELSTLHSKASALIYSGLRFASLDDDGVRLACAHLLLNASNSFASAVALLRMGYVLQPGIILRSFLEAISTSLHLLQRPADLAAYESHKLQSPKTIATAKNVLPPFGSMYGHFSENFAHIGRLHKSITRLGVYSERDDALTVNLSALRMACWLLYVTAELAFNALVEQPRYWYPTNQGYRYDPSEDEKAWMTTFFQMDQE